MVVGWIYRVIVAVVVVTVPTVTSMVVSQATSREVDSTFGEIVVGVANVVEGDMMFTGAMPVTLLESGFRDLSPIKRVPVASLPPPTLAPPMPVSELLIPLGLFKEPGPPISKAHPNSPPIHLLLAKSSFHLSVRASSKETLHRKLD